MKIQKLGMVLVLTSSVLIFAMAETTLIKIIRDKTKTEDQKISHMKELIRKGVNVDTKSPDIPYFTPLMLAADGGYYSIVQFLLESGADVKAQDNLNNTALFYAARKGHIKIVELLLSRDANVQHVNKQGRTILQDILYQIGANEPKENKEARAQFRKNILAIISILLAKGADINKQGSEAEFKRSPIMWAAYWKDLDLVKFLKDKGADLHRSDVNGHGLAFYLPDPKTDKNLTQQDVTFINNLKDEILESGWTHVDVAR